jgi:hypothetical protein
MKTHVFRALAGAMALFGICGLAHARGETGDESALAVFESRAAPLALSSNGQWRVHVDAKNVLHRVNLLDKKQEQQLALPVGALQIAASRTAQKIAFTSSIECVGLVDFGNPPYPAPQLLWISNAPVGVGEKVRILNVKLPTEHDCKPQGQRSVVAMSTDGQLVANATQVYDLESQTVMATLPSSVDDIGRRRTLAVQFTDNNTKIFLATATLGAGYESGDSPSDLQFSIWDLQRKSLFNLAGGARRTQFVPEMLLFHYAAQTGALSYVQSDRYFQAREKTPNTSEEQPLLDVLQSSLHSCQAKPVARLALAPWQWVAYAVDPLGRWIAGVKKLDGTALAGAGRSGRRYVEELSILDMRSGKVMETVPLVQALHGLVVTPDGSSILGITPLPLDPKPGGDVVHITVPPSALSLPKVEGAAFAAAPCKIENETPWARKVERTARLLEPLWTRPMPALGDRQSLSAPPLVCNSLGAHGGSFTMPDQTLWLDQHADMAQLDWRTGRPLKSLPTPRKRPVCSTPMPEAGGFINYRGDTASFQTFESLLSSGSQRQILDTKKGWYVHDITWSDDAGQAARSFSIVWRIKPETTPGKNARGEIIDTLISIYDASSKRRTQEVGMQADNYEMGVWDGSGVMDAVSAATCPLQPSAGERVVRFERSYFDSFRAYRCGADRKSLETVFWTGLDIAPKPSTAGPFEGGKVLAMGASIGVVADGRGMVRIYDLHARKELAQIQPAFGSLVHQVRLSEERGIVVLESMDQMGERSERNLRAYAFR